MIQLGVQLMGKTIGIIQPGKLGDIIICLPIAKYWADKGYKVVWPIFRNFEPMFKEVIEYVEFIPITSNVYTCIFDAYDALVNKYICDKIFDIAATFPGSKCTDEYVNLGDGFGPEKFDEFKYRKTEVPFDLKWKLEYNRNLEKENEVYNLYVKEERYDVVSTKHSRGNLNVTFDSKNQIISLNENHNIFHWVKVLENAQTIALVDSAPANLVEQLNISCKKIVLRKPGHPIPTFRNKWIIKEV